MGNACAGSPRTTPPQALQASRRGEDADKLRRIRSSAIFSESLSPLGAAYRRLAFAKLGHVRLTELARAIVENEDLFARVAGLVIAHPLVFTFREVDNSVRNNGRFDVGGVLFHLATQGNTVKWDNPDKTGTVKCTWSSVYSGPESRLTSGPWEQPNSSFTDVEAGRQAWMAIDLGPERRLLPDHYCLRNDYCGAFNTLRNWELQACEGSARHKGRWVTLSRHDDDRALAKLPYYTAGWPLAKIEAGPFRTFRLLQTGPNAYGGDELHCGGFEIYGALSEVSLLE